MVGVQLGLFVGLQRFAFYPQPRVLPRLRPNRLLPCILRLDKLSSAHRACLCLPLNLRLGRLSRHDYIPS